MRRFVRVGSWIMAATMVLTMGLSGCGKSNVETSKPQETEKPKESEKPKEDKPVTVNFTNFSGAGDSAKYLEAMQKEFEKKNPSIKLKIETIGFGDYFSQMQTRVAANTAPDCYELNYENFISYAKKNVLLDMAQLFTETKFDSSIINKNALEAFKTDGKQYGLPASFSNVLLIYNKELFDKAGVAYPTDKWTWDDEQKAAEKIKALGKDTFGIFHPVHFWEFYKVVQQNNGSILSADKKKFTINTPQNVETLQFMVDRVRKSNVMPSEAQLAGAGDWDLFKSGRLGMIVTGSWAFVEFAKDCKFKWDIAIEPGKTSKATHFFSNGLVLNKDSKITKQAFEWVKFMSSSKEAAQIRVDAGWELPPVTYQDINDSYIKKTPPENKKAVFDSLQYLVNPPVIEQFNEMADIMGIHLKAAVDGSKTAAKALEDAQKELESKITLK